MREDNNARVIDTNNLIEEKLERIRFVLQKIEKNEDEVVYSDGVSDNEMEALTGEDNQNESGEGIIRSNVIKAQPVKPQDEIVIGPTKEELIAQAQSEIERMKSNALAEIESQKQSVYEEAQKRGYEDGMQAARQEASKLWQDLEQEKENLENKYDSILNELEPKFVEILTNVYEKIFEVNLSEYQNIVLSLLRNSIRKIEGSKNFLVHVSKDDFTFVSEHRQELLSDSNQEGTTIDVIEDQTLKKNDCIIETVNGIYDCGLGTQLSELKKRLCLLSYEEDDK